MLGLRPERITDHRGARDISEGVSHPLHIQVEVVEPTGPDTLVATKLNGKRVLSRVHPSSTPKPGEQLTVAVDVSNAVLFDARTGERIDRVQRP